MCKWSRVTQNPSSFNRDHLPFTGAADVLFEVINVMQPARIALQIPALVLAVLGFLLIFIALASPAWQVVFARELQQWVQSGLWLNCQTRPTGMYTCTYTFSEHDFDFYTSAEVVNLRTPPFYAWQRTLLHIFLFAQVCTFFAMVSFCVSNMHTAQKMSLFCFNGFIALATVVCVGCVLAFTILSHMVEYRFYHVSVSGIYEKHVGYSYYLALVGTIFYLLSLIFSVVYTIKALRTDRFAYAGSPDYHARQFRSGGDYHMTNEDLFAMRALPDIPQKHFSRI